MTELSIRPYTMPEKIEFNFEELKAEIAEKAKTYELAVYTEDTIKLAKEDRANLNRLKKALNDERIRREKEYNAPFAVFKAQINELIAIIDGPVEIIDRQVKAFEEEQRKQKADYIKAWFLANRERIGAPKWLEIGRIASNRWGNASTKVKEIQDEITQRCEKIRTDLETIASLPEYAFEAGEEYKRTLDLNAAITEGRRQADIQKRKEELRKAEETRRAAEEAKRAAEALKAAESAKNIESGQITTQEQKAAEIESQSHTEPNPTKAASAETAHWVGFEVYITTEQAGMLLAFLKNREIPFRATQKGGKPC